MNSRPFDKLRAPLPTIQGLALSFLVDIERTIDV